MSLSAVYILDAKGKVLINRDFRGDLPQNCVERFVSFISGAYPVYLCVASHKGTACAFGENGPS